jgi:hypothetical protein
MPAQEPSMNDHSPRPEIMSLAQALYEANPAVGWNPKWENLDPIQRMWWTNYERLVRNYLEAETHRDSAESHQNFAETNQRVKESMSAS